MSGDTREAKKEKSKELDGKRTHLLLELAAIRPNDNNQMTLEQMTTISQLKESNNRLVDERLRCMDSTVDSMLGDPSRILPIEIFVQVIELALCDLYLADWNIEDLLSFTLVSTRWRHILMSTPSLWRYICLKDDDTFYSQEKLSLALNLSGNTPLIVRLRPPFNNWSEIVSELQPHRHRIVELMIDLGKDYSHDTWSVTTPLSPSATAGSYGRVTNVLEDLGSLASLKKLGCTSWIGGEEHISDVYRFIERNPQLEELAGIWLTQDLLNSDDLKKLTSFRSRLEPLSIVPHLPRMKKLSKATFDNYSFSPGQLGNTTNMAADPDPTNIPSQDMSSLRWTYYSQINKPSIPLLSRTTTTLVKLRLHTTLPECVPFFLILHEFQKLETLHFHLEVKPNDVIAVPLPPPTHPPSPSSSSSSLQTVWFDFSSSWSADIHPDPRVWGPPFALLLHRFLGYVKDISVSAYTLQSSLPWELIESSQFEHLETLSLSLSEEVENPPEGFNLPKGLKNLDISGMHYDLPNLRSESVATLTVSSFRSGPQASKQLDAELWPAVTDLSIPGSAIAWRRGSDGNFKHLRSVELEVEWEDKWDHSSQFCRDLALYSEYMPVLEEIHFSHPPEWDMLCILLERYNFRTTAAEGGANTRISCISFGGDVPYSLLEPIKSLCAGKFVERPSNLELSWVGNVDIIRDRDLPGCVKCMKKLLPCRSSRTAGLEGMLRPYYFYSRRMRRDIDAISDYCLDILMDMPLEGVTDDPVEYRLRKLFIPSYPDTEEEILETWQAREEAWQALRKEMNHLPCLNSNGGRRIRINEYKVSVWGAMAPRWYIISDERRILTQMGVIVVSSSTAHLPPMLFMLLTRPSLRFPLLRPLPAMMMEGSFTLPRMFHSFKGHTVMRRKQKMKPVDPIRVHLTEQEDQLCTLLDEFCTSLNAREPEKDPVVCRIAGGWVRDKPLMNTFEQLLDVSSHDIDLAINTMTGEAFAQGLLDAGKVESAGTTIASNPDQSKHLATTKVKVLGFEVDLVNLRSEAYSDDSRIPEVFGTPFEDAERRDLTINAMFYNVHSRAIEDFTGKGIDDLKEGRVRTPLDPKTTFEDDPLRILRCVRFASRLGFDERLATKISRERIGEEMDKMIQGPDPVYAITLLHSFDLLPSILTALPQALESASSPIGPVQQAVDGIATVETLLSSDDRLLALDPILTKAVLSEKSTRARFRLAGLLTPFRGIKYMVKSKTIPLVDSAIRDGLKLGSQNFYLNGIPSLFSAAELIRSGFPDPLLTGSRAQIGQIMDSIILWQLENPDKGSEDCQTWLKEEAERGAFGTLPPASGGAEQSNNKKKKKVVTKEIESEA
ncbi:CCA tRNA nucleotidyltransferase, mitochondrial [Serendipita sp. 399]|nr:CCA tRNA nucleotidyltransferase, mitochondrial [Serendipita sp. 399]